MEKFTWTTSVEINAETEEDSYRILIDMDTHDFSWEIEDIEQALKD